MPKDNEVDEKAVAFAMTDDQGDAPMTIATTDRKYAESWASEGIRVDPLYSAATVAELRAEVERLQFQLGLEQVCVYERNQKIAMLADKADAAERRVGDVTALLDQCFTSEIERVSTVEFNSNSICRKFYGELKARFSKALTGADPT